MKLHLCKCNNCDSVLIDENPQIGAKEIETNGTELNMVWIIKKEETFWGCPKCGTDEFLADL